MADAENDQADYDLAAWTAEQRAALDLLLMGANVPHGWDGARLVVAGAHRQQVDGFVGRVRQPTAQPGRPPSSEPGELADPGRRFMGSVIDGVLLSIVNLVLAGTLAGFPEGAFGRRVIAIAFSAAYGIVGVGLWGRTFGKRVVGTRVVDADSRSLPGWGPAAVRWEVQAAPGLALLVSRSPIATFVTIGLSAVVYAGILRDPSHRGLHDKAAGTLVVNA